MNLTPIYELRSRLRTAMIAGTNLLSEDFRLKKAVEDIKPLEALSPVFAKIGQLTATLLSETCQDKEGVLIDTITLVDALLCTQGQVAVAGEMQPITANSIGSVITNASYSVVKTVVEALTTSGNGHYQFVVDTHNTNPEIFKDYRIKAAMIAALGASYTELADLVARWLKEEGREIIPLLQKDFEPKGKKEMVRRVQVMEAVAGAECNDFYLKMLPEAQKDVKNAFIYALRHHTDNVELLLELLKKEKGNTKKIAYFALATMEDERAEQLFKELYQKKPSDVMTYLRMSTTKWAAKMVSECFINQLGKCKEADYGQGDNLFTTKEIETLGLTLKALVGKKGSEICEAFRIAYEIDEIYYKVEEENKLGVWKTFIPRKEITASSSEVKGFSEIMPYFLEMAIRLNPEEELCALAEELFEKKSKKNRNIPYFTAVLTAKMLGKEDCSEWLKKQMFAAGVEGKKKKSLSNYIVNAIKGLVYHENKNRYVLRTYLRNDVTNTDNIYEQPVTQDIVGKVTDLFIEYASADIDREMSYFVNQKDKEYCKRLGDYFYRRAKVVVEQDRRFYWMALKECGYEKCEGLLVSYVQRNTNLSAWDVYSRLWELPGNVESFEKEIEEVHKMIRDGKVTVQNWNETVFYRYAENVKERKRDIF